MNCESHSLVSLTLMIVRHFILPKVERHTHTQKKGEIMNVVAQHTLTTRELGSLKGKILYNFNRESVNVGVYSWPRWRRRC